MSVVSPFRVTPDDLPGLDGKTADALTPLLDALNVTVQQLVNAVAQIPVTIVRDTTFTSSASGTASVDFAPPSTKPMDVRVRSLNLANGDDIAAVYSWTWKYTGTVVRLLFVGLGASKEHKLSVALE